MVKSTSRRNSLLSPALPIGERSVDEVHLARYEATSVSCYALVALTPTSARRTDDYLRGLKVTLRRMKPFRA